MSRHAPPVFHTDSRIARNQDITASTAVCRAPKSRGTFQEITAGFWTQFIGIHSVADSTDF
jgi:hypothetical protein